MDNILNRYLEVVTPLIETAREYLEQGETLTPTAFIVSLEDRKLMPVEIDTESNAKKDLTAINIKNYAKLMKADFILIICEAWRLKESKANDFENIMKKYGSIAATPKNFRDDIVSFTLETHEGVWMANSIIKRKNKSKRTIDIPKFQLSDQLSGRFVGLLNHEIKKEIIH